MCKFINPCSYAISGLPLKFKKILIDDLFHFLLVELYFTGLNQFQTQYIFLYFHMAIQPSISTKRFFIYNVVSKFQSTENSHWTLLVTALRPVVSFLKPCICHLRNGWLFLTLINALSLHKRINGVQLMYLLRSLCSMFLLTDWCLRV